MEYEKLIAAINERRKWNMEHLDCPNLVNNGLVQALAIIEWVKNGSDTDAVMTGASVTAYDRKSLKEIANDPKNMVLEGDDYVNMLKPLGYPGDVIRVVRPDGVETICVEESVGKIMTRAFADAMLEKGSLTQEQYDEYLNDPFIDCEDEFAIRLDGPESDGDIVPLFKRKETNKE